VEGTQQAFSCFVCALRGAKGMIKIMNRKKFGIQNDRVLHSILLLAMIVSMLLVGVSALTVRAANANTSSNSMKASIKTVKTAKLSKKNKKARKAYQRLLAKEQFRRTESNKFSFALIDLDGDGIDELLVDSGGDCMANTYYELYTFQKGKAKDLLGVGRVPFVVYEDGTLEYDMGHMDHIEYSYYKLKNGTLRKRMQLYGFWPDSISESERKNAEYAEGMYWTIRKIGKKAVSYDDCQKWMEKFQSSHTMMKVKYYKNTAKNRKLMTERD